MKRLQELTDEKLVELVRSDDQELFAQLVKRYQNKLVRYAQYLVRDEASAYDVVQDAFIKAFVNLRGFNVKKSFSAWIYRIVHNEAVNHLRKKKREVSLEHNDWIKRKLRSKEDIVRDFELGELKKTLRRNLDKLPLKYRSPLTLFFLEEQSYRGVSRALQLPVGTVGTRINRGKKLLAAYYLKDDKKRS